MKTELLIQLDGLAKKDSDRIFLLAASNIPWDLDQALLRRLEKRVLVPLPSKESRQEMMERLLRPVSKVDFNQYAEMTEGYSGSDLALVAKEAHYIGVRKKIFEIEEKQRNKKSKIDNTHEELVITEEEIDLALKMTKPSAEYDTKKFESWNEKFGSG